MVSSFLLMEAANRDESSRCLKRAKSALNRGAASEAERLARKSLRLCRTVEAEGNVVTVFNTTLDREYKVAQTSMD